MLLGIYAAYCFVVMPRPRGLRIHAPGSFQKQAAVNANANSLEFARLDPASFSAGFGLDYYKVVEKAPVENVEKKPEIIEVASSPVEPTSDLIDLKAVGYRLKGIILEKDGNSAAFIYDPDSKKNIIVREKSPGEIKILETDFRSVRLRTPAGEGILELEDSKNLKGHGLSAGSSAMTQLITQKSVQRERMLRAENVTAAGIADMVNAGHFQVRNSRGKFNVKVRKVPEALLGYGLREGDEIIGTGNSEFKKSQDVAIKLGELSNRPDTLKVIRNRRVIYLQPPAKSQANKKEPR
ncbi:MAG: hypothetical protein Kow0029_13420 [Candidatus Rifleibacteriota bacterium]